MNQEQNDVKQNPEDQTDSLYVEGAHHDMVMEADELSLDESEALESDTVVAADKTGEDNTGAAKTQKLPQSKPFDFSSEFSENFPGILKTLNISLAVTSYQAGRLIFIRTPDGEVIDTNFKAFPRPMGIHADEERLTIGTLTQVIDFRRNDKLLHQIQSGDLDESKLTRKVRDKRSEEQQKRFLEVRKKELEQLRQADSLYIPRASLTTGMINIHDIDWGDEGLWVVNSTFSCLATLDPEHSFVPRWKPHFISELAPEDRCHLNGMTLKDGKPKYVTTFNKFNQRDSWHNSTEFDGTLMDVDNNEILLDGLCMPHSPRYHEGKVYFCDSGKGLICRYDPETGKREDLLKVQGYPRGMDFYGPIMFVGMSRLRATDIKRPAPISKEFEETFCGIRVINIETAEILASIDFQGDVDQIYDIAVVPESISPDLLEPGHYRIRHVFDFPLL